MKKKVYLLLLGLSVLLRLQAQQEITLLFVGDLMQHQAQIDRAYSSDGSYNYSQCFSLVKPLIEKADLSIGNLEVTLAGKPYTGYPQFSAPDAYLEAIREAGFDVLLTANNHCLDRQQKGLERTLHLLDSMDIPSCGTYLDSVDRRQRYPLLIEKEGFRLVFLCYTYGTNGYEVTPPNHVNRLNKVEMAADILQARKLKPDALIACLHWGVEYDRIPQTEQRELANWLLQQGVDHLICSHPHVVQPMERVPYAQHPAQHAVVYSLGNFVSNMSAPHTDVGAMVWLTLRKQGSVTKMKTCNYQLVWTERPVCGANANFRICPEGIPAPGLTAEGEERRQTAWKETRRLLQEKNRNFPGSNE